MLRVHFHGDGTSVSLVDENGIAKADGHLVTDAGIVDLSPTEDAARELLGARGGQVVRCELRFEGTVV